MKTFGQAYKEYNKVVTEALSFGDTLNQGMRNIGMSQIPGTQIKSVISNEFDENKKYYPNIIHKWHMFAPGDSSGGTSEVVSKIEQYCINNIPQIEKILRAGKRIFDGVPPNYLQELEQKMQQHNTNNINGYKKAITGNINSLSTKLSKPGINLYNKFLWNQQRERATEELNDLNEVTSRINIANPQIKDPLLAEQNPYFTQSPIQIYQYRLKSFCRYISQTVAETNKKGWGAGFYLQTLFTGFIGLTDTSRSQRLDYMKLKKQPTLEEYKEIHDNIIVPVFIKPGYLLYLTEQEWERVQKGGMIPRFFNAVKSVGKELYSAGAGAPKTKV